MNEISFHSTTRQTAPELTLRDVLAPLFRRRHLLTLSFFGILLGAILSAVLLPKQYEAHMKILVKRERVDPVVTTEATAQLAQPAPAVTEEEKNSEVEILRSRDLLEKVVLANELQHQSKQHLLAFLYPERSAEIRVSEAVTGLAKTLSVQGLTKTNLIEVNYKSSDPQLSYRVLSTLANLYMEKHLAVHRPAGAFDFFQQETERYQKKLEDAETRLARFGREKNVASPQIERDLTLQKLNEFEATLHQTEASIAETEHRINDLEAQLKVIPQRLTTTQKVTDNSSTLQVLESTLSTLEIKHSDMVAHFEPGYRPRKDLEAQIAQIRVRMAEIKHAPLREDTTDLDPAYLWLVEERVKSRADLATLKARAAVTSNNVQLYRRTALALGQNQIEQEDLLRTAKTEEGNFLLYLNKREESRISDALDTKRIVNVAIAEAATVPALPTYSPLLVVLLGTIIACSVSTGIAFVSDYVDPSLRTKEEVEKILEIPLLAAIPKSLEREECS